MREVVSEQEARKVVQEETGKALVAIAQAKTAPPGTLLAIAGTTFVVTDDHKLKAFSQDTKA